MYLLQYSAFASERPKARTWGCRTCFLSQTLSNVVTPLSVSKNLCCMALQLLSWNVRLRSRFRIPMKNDFSHCLKPPKLHKANFKFKWTAMDFVAKTFHANTQKIHLASYCFTNALFHKFWNKSNACRYNRLSYQAMFAIRSSNESVDRFKWTISEQLWNGCRMCSQFNETDVLSFVKYVPEHPVCTYMMHFIYESFWRGSLQSTFF